MFCIFAVNLKIKIMNIIFILVAVYLFSAILSWLYTHVAHSENGIWESSDADIKDILAVFIPILNTACLLSWLDRWPIRRSINYNKFFNIKK